jgi:polar amino acid transport system permease protein
MFLMLASWVFLLEGIHALLSMFEDVMNEGSSWPVWAYAAVAAVSFLAAGLLYTSKRWAVYAGIVAALISGLAVFPIPAFVGGFLAFSVVEIALLLLGFRAAGEREAIQAASADIPWRIKLTLVWIVIGIVVIRIFLAVEFDLAWIRETWWAIVSRGLPLTLLISVSAIVLAIVLALLGALARLSRNPITYGVAGFYTSFFRGTPLLVQIFLIYLGLAQIGGQMRGTALEPFGQLLTLHELVAAILAIGLNYGAYMTEIFRAGIQSVGHGQGEAADALGMSYGLKMRRVVLPQAVRVIIPPTGNEFIAMTKDSSLAFTIGVLELFRRAELAGRENATPMEALVIAAAVYWLMTAILTFFQSRLERNMARGYVRTGEAGTKRTARKSYLPAPTPATQPGVTAVEDVT